MAAWGDCTQTREQAQVSAKTFSLGYCSEAEGRKDALAFGGREKSSWGQKLVSISRRKSQRARGSGSGRASRQRQRAQRGGLGAPVSVGRGLLWRLSMWLQRQLLKFKLVYAFLLLVVPRGQV